GFHVQFRLDNIREYRTFDIDASVTWEEGWQISDRYFQSRKDAIGVEMKVMRSDLDHRREVVIAFREECVWARSIRTHFATLYESGERRRQLLAEVANTFFGDLNAILIEYILLQQCTLTDPSSSRKHKENLSTNDILSLDWHPETAARLKDANATMMRFRTKVVDARRKLVAHSDLKTRMSLAALGAFTEEEEASFWTALQRFVHEAHG